MRGRVAHTARCSGPGWNGNRYWGVSQYGQSYTPSEQSVLSLSPLVLLTYFQDIILTAPDLTYTLVRPLEDKYNAIQRAGNRSVVFAFLLNRIYFIRDEKNLTNGPLSATRAALCELLAIRILRDNGNSVLDLVRTLTTCWPVWSGAEPHILQLAKQLRDDDLEDHVGNAIEMAIISKARRFIKSSPCQRVIHAIWIGRCVYQPESSHAILSDRYKRTPIHFYDPHKAPLLDHYRLKVPAIRAVLEYINFLILFILFVTAIEMNQRHRINTAESIFMVYALGFTLEKLAAMQEHGIKAFGLISLTFILTSPISFHFMTVTAYFIYATFRIYGIVYHDQWARDIGIDSLAVIACLLFPRLAFVTLKNNLMVLSLRAMMMQFVALMLIAAFCFCGFFYALWTTIAWWMLDLWFGLDASGFDRAGEFDPVFGPILMIMYACLSNTLLLTGTWTFYCRPCLGKQSLRSKGTSAPCFIHRLLIHDTLRVKADSLFSYQPPVNLVAVCILLPAGYVLSPRWFHKVTTWCLPPCRVTNFPILLVIAWYERESQRRSASLGFYETITSVFEKVVDTLPRPLKRMCADIDIHWFRAAGYPANQVVHPRVLSAQRARRPLKEHEPDHHPQSRTAACAFPSAERHPTTTRPLRPSPSADDWPPRSTNPTLPKVHSLKSFNRSSSTKHPRQKTLSRTARAGVVDRRLCRRCNSATALRRAADWHLCNLCISARAETSLWATKPVGRSALPLLDTREEMLGGPLSASPDHQEERGIATVEQAEEIVEENGGMSEWMKRMERIEGRQERIEELLVQLHAQLQR
ncbi:hypothetical protein J3R83DRAFT_8454 [Lanmaoa asiatica]|nr:hypothetical protein J3R83DRAFT_8454 [Lanmaoa asiatica]